MVHGGGHSQSFLRVAARYEAAPFTRAAVSRKKLRGLIPPPGFPNPAAVAFWLTTADDYPQVGIRLAMAGTLVAFASPNGPPRLEGSQNQ
jgi:hypothetical protein